MRTALKDQFRCRPPEHHAAADTCPGERDGDHPAAPETGTLLSVESGPGRQPDPPRSDHHGSASCQSSHFPNTENIQVDHTTEERQGDETDYDTRIKNSQTKDTVEDVVVQGNSENSIFSKVQVDDTHSNHGNTDEINEMDNQDKCNTGLTTDIPAVETDVKTDYRNELSALKSNVKGNNYSFLLLHT